jgi:hypothetical protein
MVWKTVAGVVVAGHQIASGRSKESPYPRGSIEMQIPFFKELGLDLSSDYPATLNVSLRPAQFVVQMPQYTFHGVKWSPEHAPEDFSFSPCRLSYYSRTYGGWVYYPRPETKLGHFQDPGTIELILPRIPGIQYGDRVEVSVRSEEILIVREGEESVWNNDQP